jgi:hypothetical protein
MAGDRAANIGGDAAGNVIVTGVGNNVDAKINVGFSKKIALPPASSVDISAELVQIRGILEKLGGEHAGRIGRALDDASEEIRKPKPDKDEIGSALGRALDYAQKGDAFANEVEKLAPHITNAVAWLGSNWYRLLSLVGLVL